MRTRTSLGSPLNPPNLPHGLVVVSEIFKRWYSSQRTLKDIQKVTCGNIKHGIQHQTFQIFCTLQRTPRGSEKHLLLEILVLSNIPPPRQHLTGAETACIHAGPGHICAGPGPHPCRIIHVHTAVTLTFMLHL